MEKFMQTVFVLGIACALTCFIGCGKKEGPLEKAGKAADKAAEDTGEALKDGAKKAEEAAKDAEKKAEDATK